MLCKAAFLEGQDVQSFTFFGAERRGAPVVAFARLDSEPIMVRCQIHHPNHLVVLDPVLTQVVDVFSGVQPGCLAYLNADAMPDGLAAPAGVEVVLQNATRIALQHRLGSAEAPIVNTAVLGGFAGLTGIVGCPALAAAIRDTVPVQADRNVAAMVDAYAEGQERRAAHAQG
jgi:2-oxoacid:acceptor oxidoreductase gamma subunit (pyruvate/2-ketoisovalerate family)